ncbi:MAG: hypothetical protein NT178_02345 [Proteobacteria bacterium]|nr:hypothetical protein [Pseudomonadota bacterium]
MKVPLYSTPIFIYAMAAIPVSNNVAGVTIKKESLKERITALSFEKLVQVNAAFKFALAIT